MLLNILIVSLTISIINITIISKVSIIVSIISMLVHGSAPLNNQESLGVPTMH